MISKVRLLLLWIALIPLGLTAQGIATIIDALQKQDLYAAKAIVTVTSPGGEKNEAVYDVVLNSYPRPGARNSECNYIVDYKPRSASVKAGFSALVDTVLYRYDGYRLREISVKKGSGDNRLASESRFAELLPQNIAAEISEGSKNPYIRMSVHSDGPDFVVLDMITEVDSTESARKSFRFTSTTLSPVGVDAVYNESTPAEMSLSATFTPMKAEPVTIAMLKSRHGEIIDRFSAATKCPENFVGYPMLPFTLPAAGSGRYTFKPGALNLLVFVDDRNNPDALEEVTLATREALAHTEIGAYIDVSFIILSRFTDALRASESSTGHERLLLGGEHLAGELGIRTYPLFMLIGEDGHIDGVASAQNISVGEIVKSLIGD